MTPIDPHAFAPALRRVMLALFLCCTFLLFSTVAAQAASISGTVTDKDGRPLQEVGVTLYTYSVESGNWVPSHFFGYSFVGGNYSIGGFPAGTYRLGFTRPYVYHQEYYNNQTTLQDATDIVFEGDSTHLTGYDAALPEDGVLLGKVVDPDGKPIPGISVNLYRKDGSPSFADGGTIESNSAGEFRFTIRTDEPYTLGFFASTYRYMNEYYNDKSTLADADTFTVLADQIMTVTVELSRTKTISGTVTDNYGQRIESLVKLYKLEGSDWIFDQGHYLGQDIYPTEAQNRSYEFYGLKPGYYRVEFTGDEILSESYNDKSSLDQADIIDLTGIEDFAIANATVTRRGIITGTVTDKNNLPIRDIEVSLYYDNGGEWTIQNSTTTNASGNYIFRSALPDRSYRIGFASTESHWAFPFMSEYYNNSETITTSQTITVSAETILPDINVQLDSYGVITGIVTGAQGQPLFQASVSAYDQASGSWENYATTDANGQYQFGVSPGKEYSIKFSHIAHEVEFYDNKTSIASGTVVTAAINTVVPNINAQLASGPVISGKVTDNNGSALEGILVTAYEPVYDRLIASTRTDASGNYAISLAPNTYKLRFNADYNYRDNEDYVAEYYENAQSIETATPIVLVSGFDQTINAELAIVPSISGYRLAPDGRPAVTEGDVILYKRVMVNGEPQWQCCYGSTFPSSVDGSYKLWNIEPGEYTLYFQAYMGQYSSEYYDNQPTIETATILTVTDRTILRNINAVMGEPLFGRIVINVADENNNPLPGIEVVGYSEQALNGTDPYGPFVQTTDQNGQVKIVSSKPYWLEFRDPNRSIAGEFYNDKPNIADAESISVAPFITQSIHVNLGPSTFISGRITDVSGQPIFDAMLGLFAYWPEHPEQWQHTNYGTSTDSDGYYRIDGLTPGRRYHMYITGLGQQYFYPDPFPNDEWGIAISGDIIPSAVGLPNVDMVLLQPGEVMAAFSGTPRNGTGSLVVNFTDASLGNVTGYSWDFGDGTSSTEKNPSHTYQAGTYTVTLTVNSGSSSDSETKVSYIVVDDTEITEVGMAQGSHGGGANVQPKVGDTLYFSATATGSNVQFLWDFGDSDVESASEIAAASVPTGQYVQHAYSSPGDYTITLIARNGVNEKVTTQSLSIYSLSDAPDGGESDGNKDPDSQDPDGGGAVSVLSVDAPSKVLVGQSVNFVASVGSGSNVAYSWDFGDGQSGTGDHVSHSYSEAGAYTVTVTASNGTGSVEQQAQIIVEHGLHIPRLSR